MAIFNWERPGWAVVTGASAGLGEEFARALAAEGFSLVLVARREDRLRALGEDLAAKHGIAFTAVPADLATPEGAQVVIATIQGLDVDLLINNAGFGSRWLFHQADFEGQRDMLVVHTQVPVALMRAVLPGMVARNRGGVINLASLGSFFQSPGAVMYNATKKFLVEFSRGVAMELRDTAVRVQALCPGFTHTEFHSVGDFAGTRAKKAIPKGMWMRADAVVHMSLQALVKGKVVYIPGIKNKIFARIFRVPLLGRYVERSLAKKQYRVSIRRDSPR
jgi:short-subunit dehydrogenase